MLNGAMGTVEQIDEARRIVTARDGTGHALYGPYVEIDPGHYMVTFDIAITQEEDGDYDKICAIVDVTADFGEREIAFDRVLVSQLSNQGSVTLEFDVIEPLRDCEFRVWTTGAVELLIKDQPTWTRRVDDRPAADRLAILASDNRSLVKKLWLAGVDLDIRGGRVAIPVGQFDAFKGQVLVLESDRLKLAERVVEGVGYRGCGENSLYRAFVGTDRPLHSPPQPVPLTSALCNQTHFGYDQYRFWTCALKEQPKYQRKQWEFFFVAQALYERGFLIPGRTGLVFGAGEEQLPALFASFGVKIVATDQAASDAVATGWAATHEHTYDIRALNQRGICTDRMFSELVSFTPVDMNDIPAEFDEKFDFCWSACALEHLGSLEHGLSFIEKSMRTLRPGGLAVHTTEFNLSSNDDTIETEGLSLYRRRDIDRLLDRLNRAGYEPSPVDWESGEGFAEIVVDVAPYLARGEPHIRLQIGQYDCTSIGIIVQKPARLYDRGEPAARSWLGDLLRRKSPDR